MVFNRSKKWAIKPFKAIISNKKKYMSFTFNEFETKKVYIASGEKENVRLAVADFISDIKKACGTAETTSDIHKADIIVCSRDSEEFSSLAGSVCFTHEEEFCYRVEQGKIYLLGSDDLGLMWAIYAFIEKELCIPPFYFFEDIAVENKKQIALQEKIVQEYPHTKFRGWFINDEDLLSGFQSKGKRDIDYFFYKDVIHPDLMEKIVETALRFRVNLIIPSTIVDICKPDEEELVKIASRRGLFVSQHHIEPMGVSHFGYADFVKEYGYKPQQSFVENPEAMIACWEHYAKKWSKYPRIVWQLGLRGAGDRPVWATDKNVGESLQARGELIARAIQTQYDIIAKHYKGEIYSTSTVWMEGAKLLQSGHLTLPKNTVAVFADIGMSQMFGDDFFTVPREDDRKYGIYYHSQYWHTGPHLSEGVLPEKIAYCYALAREKKSDYYAVLNASNVKEFIFSINVNAKLAWYGDKKNLDEIVTEYCTLYTPNNVAELLDGIKTYYSAMGDVGEERYHAFCDKYDFNYHHYEGLSFPVCSINDGIVCFAGHSVSFENKCKMYTPEFADTVRKGVSLMQKAYEKFTALQKKLPQGIAQAIQKQWRWQAYYWTNLFSFAKENCEAIEEFIAGNTDELSNHYAKAAGCVKNILDARAEFYTGEWSSWFADERKLNIKALYDFCIREKERFETLYH